eukprot:scaffold123194_cov16-Tisochrysis_lutea.AAC.2
MPTPCFHLYPGIQPTHLATHALEEQPEVCGTAGLCRLCSMPMPPVPPPTSRLVVVLLLLNVCLLPVGMGTTRADQHHSNSSAQACI